MFLTMAELEKENIQDQISENIRELMDELLEGVNANWFVYITDGKTSQVTSCLTTDQTVKMTEELHDVNDLSEIMNRDDIDLSHLKEVN